MPSVKSDYIVTRRGEPVTFDLARNDVSIINVTAIGTPAGGTMEKLSEPGTWFKFTPNPGYVGQEVISYTGVDAGAVSYISTVILAVRRPKPSEYIPDLVISCEGDGATLQLADQIPGEGGVPYPIVALERPNHGTLAKTDEFELSYTPEVGFLGDDRCGYSAGDVDNLIHGQIKITVGVPNTPPTISGWSESVTFNTAKVIDVLAHADDAESDPLQTIITTAPGHGVAVVLPDQTVLYTPTLGYSGADSFGVKAFDGQDLSSEATVSITVGVASFPTFTNGYRARRRIVIPARTAEAGAPSEADYVVLIRETITSFRDTANGGKVASSLGYDFRVETEAGTKLDHELELYNPATGQIVLWFRVPAWAVHQQLRVLLYYGKPDISGDEANVSGCWSGYLAVINAKTGADKTGNGRSLTPAGTINDATLIGSAGQYAGSAVAATATVAWLTGLTGITVQSYSVHDAAMAGSSKGWLTQGPTDLVDTNQGTILQFLATPSAGITNVVHFKVRCTDGNAYVLSAANTAAAGAMLVHGTWTQGTAPSIYLGGVLQVPSSAGAIRAGTTAMGAGSLYIGRGARDAAGGGYVGVLDDVRFSASARTALRIAAEAANILTPERFYGIGDEDLPADTTSTASPVAVPIFDTVQSALEKDFALAAAAYVPGGSAPSLSAAGAVAHGDAAIIGGSLRYQPVSLYVGDDGCTYTVSRAGKSSSSRLYIAVLGPPANRPAPIVDSLPKHPPTVATSKIRTVGYTLPGAAGGPYANIQAALDASAAGDQIWVATGTYAGNFNPTNEFSPDNPVVIRSVDPNARTNGNWAVFTGKINLQKAKGIWLYNLRLTYNAAASAGENDNAVTLNQYGTVTKCWFETRHPIVVACSNGTKINKAPFRQGYKCYIGWNRINITSIVGAGAISHAVMFRLYDAGSPPADTAEHKDCYVYRNYCYDRLATTNSGNDAYFVAQNSHVKGPLNIPPEHDNPRLDGCWLIENVIESVGSNTGIKWAYYMKRPPELVARNNFKRGNMNFRHGWGVQIWGNRGNGSAFLIGGGGEPSKYNDVRHNNFPNANVQLEAGSEDDNGIMAPHQACDYVRLTGNNFNSLEIGATADGAAAKNYRVHAGDTGDYLGGKLDHAEVYNHTGTVKPRDAAKCDTATLTLSVASTDASRFPGHGGKAPVTPDTDANGLIVSTFGSLNTGLELASQT